MAFRSNSQTQRDTQRGATDELFEGEEGGDGRGDAVYQAKARILNRELQDIGMGRYQVRRTPASTTKCIIFNGCEVASLRGSWVWMVCVSFTIPYRTSSFNPSLPQR